MHNELERGSCGSLSMDGTRRLCSLEIVYVDSVFTAIRQACRAKEAMAQYTHIFGCSLNTRVNKEQQHCDIICTNYSATALVRLSWYRIGNLSRNRLAVHIYRAAGVNHYNKNKKALFC